jgi:hypothetical protein
MRDENAPAVELQYVSARNESDQTRSGKLKDSGEGFLLIDTGTTSQPKFDTKQDTKILLESGMVKTVTPNKTENLGEVSEVTVRYETE